MEYKDTYAAPGDNKLKLSALEETPSTHQILHDMSPLKQSGFLNLQLRKPASFMTLTCQSPQ